MTRQARRPAAAAVELALVLPLLALLVALVVDLGRVFHATQVLDTAAANAAAVSAGTTYDPSTPDPVRAAACLAGATLDPPLHGDQVSVSTAGGTASVTVLYDHPMILGAFFPNGSVHLERTVRRRTAPHVGD